MENSDQHILPRQRSKSLIEILYKISTVKLILFGLLAYLIIAGLFSFVEFLWQNDVNHICKNSKSNYWEFLYFNFTTILTIGYGDYLPTGSFRVLSIFEAIIGLGIFSLVISFLTIKSLLPPKNTIVFSEYGYYSQKEEKFMIIYLSTANDFLINVETCSYIKFGGDWKVTQAVKAPFITKSVQTFFLDEIKLSVLKDNMTDYDCLRIGISGNIGVGNYATSIEYAFKKIIVIEDRSALSNYQGFWNVDQNIATEEFHKYFHYNPPTSKTLFE